MNGALWVMKTIGIVRRGKRLFWLLGLNGLQLYSCTAILSQIVMVSPGTHLVKNHESLSITSGSQFKDTRSPKLKNLIACTFLYPDS